MSSSDSTETHHSSFIYGVHNYAELKMKMMIRGLIPPSIASFNKCFPDDWKWEYFCRFIDAAILNGRVDFSEFDIFKSDI